MLTLRAGRAFGTGFFFAAVVLLAVGCRSRDSIAPPPAAQAAPAPPLAPASTAAHETFLTPEAAVRCVDQFLRPYTSGDAILRFPAASNDLERIINRQVVSTNSGVITRAAQADDASTEKESLWEFRRALGPKFTAANCPATEDFIAVAFADAKRINTALKKRFNRPRPNEADRDHPKLNPSFPGGHATTAGLRYRLLVAVTGASPDLEVEIFKQAWFMGFERIGVNMHYASDVAAGFVLGEMVADEVLRQAAAEPNGSAGKALAAAKEQWKSLNEW